MRIAFLCSDPEHPVVPRLKAWKEDNELLHDVEIAHALDELRPADILFLVSCSHLVSEEQRANFGRTMVLHASDLPKGRGWSPHIWEILAGAKVLTLSLIEAADPVDTGDVWAKTQFDVPETALFDEINSLLFDAELKLIDEGIRMVKNGESPSPQAEAGRTWYPRRSPSDSEIDSEKSIAEQFDLLRVADPDRYPAFMNYRGAKYRITLRKMDHDET
ncbi:formyltransferase family protein [Qipengyuania gaetbuli]|uniref:formyltransferase family protein n=1 Tax=Qipengyuania gaetbuli TaxID=266952 RepID=UPI001CFD0082|nr:formyltransferase family protein [Qipengyuania gaetbuli]